jgi:hypothetical protein
MFSGNLSLGVLAGKRKPFPRGSRPFFIYIIRNTEILVFSGGPTQDSNLFCLAAFFFFTRKRDMRALPETGSSRSRDPTEHLPARRLFPACEPQKIDKKRSFCHSNFCNFQMINRNFSRPKKQFGPRDSISHRFFPSQTTSTTLFRRMP